MNPSKRIGEESSWQLSEEALQTFPALRLDDTEQRLWHFTFRELTKEWESGEYAVKKFRSKLRCRQVARGLLNAEPEIVTQKIAELSTNLNGGDLDRYVFREFYRIRETADLRQRVQPFVDFLIDLACSELHAYVKSRQPDILDEHFKNFHVFSTIVARLTPEVTNLLNLEFLKILGAYRTEVGPNLLLVSLPAMAYRSHEITEADEKYIQPWRLDAGTPQGWASGIHTAAYNAPSRVGWKVVRTLGSAKYMVERYRNSIVNSLVRELYRKCTKDSQANAAWLGARFFKLHQSLHAINGKHPYAKLSEEQLRRVEEICRVVRVAARRTDAQFDGKIELQRIGGSVEDSVKKILKELSEPIRDIAISRPAG